MAIPQNPFLRRFASPADSGGDDLPAIPGAGVKPQKTFEGARTLGRFLNADAASHAPQGPQPVTADTPANVLRRKAAGMRWDFSPGDGMGSGARWADSPGGARYFHSEPVGFLRPRTGPESAAAVGMRTELSNLAGPLKVPNLPVRPVLAMPSGSVVQTQRQIGRTAPAATGASVPTAASGAVAASRATPITLRNPGIDSGTVVDGHRLNFGAMVNGVPTFSDGSGSIPRTVSAEQLGEAAKGNLLSRADAGALSRPLASDALGYTPSTEQMVRQRVAQLTRPITGSRPSAADFAASERNAIASGDWRSAAGTAAHNLQMDAQYGGSPQLRRNAREELAALSAGAQQSAALEQEGEQQQADIAARSQNALDVADLQGQYGLAEAQTQLQRPRAGNPVTLADGTLALVSPTTGAAMRVTLPDGSVARALQTEKKTAPIYTSSGGAQMLAQLTNQFLGVNPVSGMIQDEATGKERLPTPAEVVRAQAAARDALLALDGGMRTSAASRAPSLDQFMVAARKANPGVSDDRLREYYASTYGVK